MRIGLDYHQTISQYPGYFRRLAEMHKTYGDQVYVVSAMGKDSKHKGTIHAKVADLKIPVTFVSEVYFDDSVQSPELKLAECNRLGIEVFYDDRDDVCRLLNKNGILAMRVTRKDGSTYDFGVVSHARS